MRANHLKTTVRSFLVARGSPDELPPGDMFMFMDGGKPGNQGQLTGSLLNSDGKRISGHPSSPWSLHMFYNESEEKERERGFMSERSIETAYCVAVVAPP